jgi:hypothetical protein
MDSLTGKMEKDLSIIRENLSPLISQLDGALPEYFIDMIKRKTHLSKPALREEIKLAQRRTKVKEQNDQSTVSNEPDPDVLEMVESMKKDPMLFKRRIDAVNQLGLAGEQRTIGQICVVMDSCLIPRRSSGAQVLAGKISGPFGIGKSRAIFSCLDLYESRRNRCISTANK